ncbi:E3 ubiquitin-protein ligase TRIM39-like [Pelodytes ibericus]
MAAPRRAADRLELNYICCTYCLHASVPAAKTCLKCETSMCQDHLKIHRHSVGHVLVEPTTSLKKRLCSIHTKVLEYYCAIDSACVCIACCRIGAHKGHEVETLIEAAEKKKEKLTYVLEKLISNQAETQQRLMALQQRREQAADKETGISERVRSQFTDIKGQVEILEKRVLIEISRQLGQALLGDADLIKQLQKRKKEMSRQIHHIEVLHKMTDPIAVLEGWEPDGADNGAGAKQESGRRPSCGAEGYLDEGQVTATLHRALGDIVTRLRRGVYLPAPSEIVLDTDTAGDYLVISGDLKSASWSTINQMRPETPERFYFHQILSSEGYSSGRHYWEVETSKLGNWMVGLAYPSIDRKGNESFIGYTNKSWCLCLRDKDYSVIHNSKEQPVHPDPPLETIGVYLDYEAGRLSFYQLCDPIRHLHTFTASFSESVHAAFLVEYTGWVRIRN